MLMLLSGYEKSDQAQKRRFHASKPELQSPAKPGGWLASTQKENSS